MSGDVQPKKRKDKKKRKGRRFICAQFDLVLIELSEWFVKLENKSVLRVL